MSAAREPVTGYYVNVEIDGLAQRIYVEEAGAGVPLLCLHTAGSDTRQFRGMLNDPELLDRFRIVAFDLPWHGKSSPPSGWQKADYQLTADRYVTTICAMIEALELHRPLLLGCSIGGRAVLHMAAGHPDLVGGVIGLQSGGHVAPYYDTTWLNRPDVHGGMACAGVVSGLIGPSAPEVDRWETLWHYMQSGPGVFKGDLHFYKVDGDIRSRLDTIDTSACPVFLLTGEYDYSCPPEDTMEVHAAVAGSVATIMPGLGHFPMSENYASFRTHFLPVLEQAATARAGLVGEPATR